MAKALKLVPRVRRPPPYNPAATKNELEFLKGLGLHAAERARLRREVHLLAEYLAHRERVGYPPGVNAVMCERVARQRLLAAGRDLERLCGPRVPGVPWTPEPPETDGDDEDSA